jgi:hypothetical protein
MQSVDVGEVVGRAPSSAVLDEIGVPLPTLNPRQSMLSGLRRIP